MNTLYLPSYSFLPRVKRGHDPFTTGHLFLLFFFQFSFFLWIKVGLFLLVPFAFVFFPFITHICLSLFESELFRTGNADRRARQ
jgi:hypothetical protein